MNWKSPTGLMWLFGHLLMILFGLLFVGGNFFEKHISHELSLGIGGSLIASGIAGETLFLYIQASESTRAQIELLFEAGIVRIFPHRSVLIREQYESRLKAAKQIDVLGFGLSSFRQDFGEQFSALSRQAVVRVIILDPDFPTRESSLADCRDREEHNPAGQISNDIRAFELAVQNAAGLDRTRFQTKKLRAIPTINLFRIDDVIFWGPYLIGSQSRNMPTLLVRRGGFLFDRLKKHFDDLWDNGQLTAAI